MVNVTIEYLLYSRGENRQPRAGSLSLIRNLADPSKNTHAYPTHFDVPVITDQFIADPGGIPVTPPFISYAFFFMSVMGAENGNYILTDNPHNPTVRTGTGDMKVRVIYISQYDGIFADNTIDAWDIDTCDLIDDDFVDTVFIGDPGDGGTGGIVFPYEDDTMRDFANRNGILRQSDYSEHITAKSHIRSGTLTFVEWSKSIRYSDFNPTIGSYSPTTITATELTLDPQETYHYIFAFYRNTPLHHGGGSSGPGNNTQCLDLYNSIVAAIPGRNSAIGPDRAAKQQHINYLVDRFHASCPGLRLPPGTNYTGSGSGGSGPLGGGGVPPHF